LNWATAKDGQRLSEDAGIVERGAAARQFPFETGGEPGVRRARLFAGGGGRERPFLSNPQPEIIVGHGARHRTQAGAQLVSQSGRA
jgi:hypothetical protein